MGLDAVLSALARFRSTVASGLVGLPRSSVGKVKRTFYRFTVSPLLRACC